MKKVRSQLNFSLISKKRFVKALVKKLEANGTEICDQKFHKGKSFTNLSNILNPTNLPCLTNK